MQALILAGGEGTRLRPLTINTPKPIVPIGNKPFLLRQIETLKSAGVTDITLSLNYQPTKIVEVLGDGSDFGVNLRYLVEPAPMGTAGAYKFAEQFLEKSTIVLNGDILTDIDLLEVFAHHKNHQSVATIVLTPVENPAAYGLVETGENDKVLKFLEKPKANEIGDLNTINAGIYILEPNILNLIPRNEKYSFEYQLFPDLLHRKEKFNAFIANENYWLDIGTQERYLQANLDLVNGKIHNINDSGQHFKVAENAEISENVCIGTGCIIHGKAKIINSVLGENVIVETGVTIENSVIWSNTEINSNVMISDSIIGQNCQIGKNATLTKGSVLGDKTIITDFSFC